jgi:hypothetical protein
MQQPQAETESRLIAAARAAAVAEHGLWSQVLEYSDALTAEYCQIGEYFLRQAQLRSIALEIGVALNMSENQVHRIVSAAERLREHTPTVWAAFGSGVIDGRRAQLVSDAAGRLQRAASIARLDRKVVAYAADHTSIQLTSWLKKFVANTEPDLFDERANTEREQRRVEIEHGDEAMSWLAAYLPSHVAAAIDKRLTTEAKAMTGDPRTLAQRRADLLASWLTTNEHGDVVLGADIAVTVPASTLTGATSHPAVSADGTFIVPAAWILAAAANPFWHTLLTDTHGNTLQHRYHGRFAPEILKKAITFRDGTCQAPTCTKPAQQCEFDHREPWPHGPTDGANLWPLSGRHHQMKSHHVITWTLPTGRTAPAEPTHHAA